MKRLDGMLDKIMDIQHPKRIEDRLKEKSMKEKGNVFSVYRSSNESSISLFGTNNTLKNRTVSNGFFDTNDNNEVIIVQNAIEAVVHEMQTLVTGSIVKLRLLDDIYVNGNSTVLITIPFS